MYVGWVKRERERGGGWRGGRISLSLSANERFFGCQEEEEEEEEEEEREEGQEKEEEEEGQEEDDSFPLSG